MMVALRFSAVLRRNDLSSLAPAARQAEVMLDRTLLRHVKCGSLFRSALCRAATHCLSFFVVCVSAPLQLRTSLGSILCGRFADTTSDRSALRMQGFGAIQPTDRAAW